MEIGGYIEFEKYNRPMLHEDGIKLNCGRNALAYLLETKQIKKILMPKFMCDSCNEILKKYDVAVRYYSIDLNFTPIDLALSEDEWLYVVNFYGQLTNDFISELKIRHNHIIVDSAQAYFQKPIDGVDTLYTCRKFFGVADGAILYTDKKMKRNIPMDESFNRMHFLLGRFERTASEFYAEYVENNHFFGNEPIKVMSKLTENLLRSIDYEAVRQKRTQNFIYLHKKFKEINKLTLISPSGAFMYPLYIENGAKIRKLLQQQKIYIPTLWTAVFDCCGENELEYDMAKNILPLPIDQRYGNEELNYMIETVFDYIIEVKRETN